MQRKMILVRDGRPVAVFTPGHMAPIVTDEAEAAARRFMNRQPEPQEAA